METMAKTRKAWMAAAAAFVVGMVRHHFPDLMSEDLWMALIALASGASAWLVPNKETTT